MRNNPDDISNQIIHEIKVWLKKEISDVHANPHDDDVDSRELGILDGRYECARGLITYIKQLEKKYYDR